MSKERRNVSTRVSDEMNTIRGCPAVAIANVCMQWLDINDDAGGRKSSSCRLECLRRYSL
jgi:hypothetical protein